MSLNAQPNNFQWLNQCSLIGPFPDTGFKSIVVNANSFTTLNVNVRSDKNTTLKFFTLQSVNDTNAHLFYETSISANTNYSKKLAIPSNYFQIQIVNVDASAGTINLNTALSSADQFATQTFLNSSITTDDNTNLIRLANNYEVDLVRGIHSQFQKINIQGIQRTIPASEETIGLGEDYKYTTTGFDAQLQVTGTNDNNPAGTGARLMSFSGLDDTGVEQTENITINTGTGTVGVNYMSINRMTISSVGSLTHNEGAINFLGSGGAILGKMGATENVSHFAYFKVPAGKQLIVRDIHIAAYAPGGKIIVYEFDPSTTIQASIGEFLVTTAYQQLSYVLDGLITAGKVIKVNYVPPTETGDILINVNINAVLCPTISAF